MKVKLIKADIDVFQTIQKFDMECGGEMELKNGRIGKISVAIGTENGVSPTNTTEWIINWHTHTGVNKLTPPSPSDLRTALLMNKIGQSEIDILFSSEGIYTFYPEKRILQGLDCIHGADDMFKILKKAYRHIAKAKMSPEDKMDTLLEFYSKAGFKINFYPWTVNEIDIETK